MNYDDQVGLARALFEESGDALFLLDPETDQLLDANATAQRLTGLPLRELLRTPLDQLLRFGGPGGLGRLREAARKTATFHAQEGYYLCTDRAGAYVPVNVTLSRLHVKPRTLALVAARDVRDQHAAQAQVRRAEEELRRVLAAVSDCLWTAEVDAAGKLTYRSVSPAVEQLVGQPADWFLGGVHRWWSLIHPEDQPRWERALIRLRAGQATHEEYRVAGPDGRYRWVRESVQVSAGGRTLRLDGVIRDVSERKQVEERLRQGEAVRAFLDGVPGPAFLRDAGGRLVHANAAFAALCGKAPDEVHGRTEAEVLPGELARAWPGGEGAARAVLDVRTADGAARRWLVLRFPVRVGEGPPLQAGLVVDLTGCP